MRLSTLRDNELSLRPIEPQDAPLLYGWENDPQLAESNCLYEPLARYQAKQLASAGGSNLFENGFLIFIAQIRQDPAEDTPIGYVEIYDYDHFHRRAAIGLVLTPKWQRKGYGKRMLTCISRYALETLRLHQVYAEVVADNQSALLFFENSPYKRIATLPQWQWQHGDYQELIIYQLCPE